MNSFMQHYSSSNPISIMQKPGDKGRSEKKDALAVAPINEFSLVDMGVDLEGLVKDLTPSFSALALDRYEKRRQQVVFLRNRLPEAEVELGKFFVDYLCSRSSLSDISHLICRLTPLELTQLEELGAVRFRSIAKFEVTFTDLPSPHIKRIPAGGFVQKTGIKNDFRSLPRYFEEAPEDVTDNVEIRRILRCIAVQVRTRHPAYIGSLIVTLHQVAVYVDKTTPFDLPDGIHQDGADYIVSAIPMIMTGVVAPLSTVYDASLRPILETRLAVGHGLLHDDRNYWHSVSTLMASGGDGCRATLGLDFQLN